MGQRVKRSRTYGNVLRVVGALSIVAGSSLAFGVMMMALLAPSPTVTGIDAERSREVQALLESGQAMGMVIGIIAGAGTGASRIRHLQIWAPTAYWNGVRPDRFP